MATFLNKLVKWRRALLSYFIVHYLFFCNTAILLQPQITTLFVLTTLCAPFNLIVVQLVLEVFVSLKASPCATF